MGDRGTATPGITIIPVEAIGGQNIKISYILKISVSTDRFVSFGRSNEREFRSQLSKHSRANGRKSENYASQLRSLFQLIR